MNSHGIEQWSSEPGQAALQRLAEKPGSLPSFAKQNGLAFWERALLRQLLRGLREQSRKPLKHDNLTRRIQRWAMELDYFRAAEQRRAIEAPVPTQRKFRGNRRHLELLLKSVHVPIEDSEWNAWRERARRVEPDLRRANLAGLKLNLLDLEHARLEGADLTSSWLRKAAHADLRRTRLFATDLSGADLRGAKLNEARLQNTLLTDADLFKADLRGANLVNCTLNRAILKGADLRGALVWGASVWDTDYDETTKQTGLYLVWEGMDPIDDYDWRALRRTGNSIRVDHLDLVHFMSLIMRRRESLGDLFKEASSKIVLLLGRFTGKYGSILESLQQALEQLGYAAVRFDFEPTEDRDTIETIATLAGLAKFIIADFSDARSAPLEAQRIIPDFAVPFIPILHTKTEPISMFSALQKKYSWVLPTFVYEDEAHLLRSLKKQIVAPAEKACRRLRRTKSGAQPRPRSRSNRRRTKR